VPRASRHAPGHARLHALRIAVNGELENLKRGLEDVLGLSTKRRQALRDHLYSLEDRIVKIFSPPSARKQMPILKADGTLPAAARPPRKSPATPRARSATLRAMEKT